MPILASAHSIERAPSIRARKLGTVRVAGRSEPVTVCQPLGVDGGPTLTAEDDTAAPWEGVLTATGK